MKEKLPHIFNYRWLPIIAMLFLVRLNFCKLLNSAAKIANRTIPIAKHIGIFVGILIISSIKTFGITNALKLRIENSTYSDETVVRYIQGATVNFDGSYDAWKMFSSNPAVPSIYTMIASSSAASINAYPPLQTDDQVEVYARVGSTGAYSITATEIGAFPTNIDIFIENTTNGYVQNIRKNPVYTFYVSDTGVFNSKKQNFKIYFSLPVVFSASANVPPTIAYIATKKGIDNWTYVVKNYSNAVVVTDTIQWDTDTLHNLSPGNYSLVSYFGNETTQEQPFVISQGITTRLNDPAKGTEEYKLFYENNVLTVDFNNHIKQQVVISVFTIEGREVINTRLFGISKAVIPVNDQASAIYIVKLQADNMIGVKKIAAGSIGR